LTVQVEKFPGATEDDPPRLGKDLLPAERKVLLTERIKTYAQRVYKRVSSKPVTDTRIAGVCQRENGFYIDTVRSFRDRRYEYKGLVKRWKGALAKASADVRTAHRAAHQCNDACAFDASARSSIH
jgi:DNA polymerase epsilon subunit 1